MSAAEIVPRAVALPPRPVPASQSWPWPVKAALQLPWPVRTASGQGQPVLAVHSRPSQQAPRAPSLAHSGCCPAPGMGLGRGMLKICSEYENNIPVICRNMLAIRT